MRSAHSHTSLVRLPAAEVQMVLTILARGHINTAVWFKETTSLTLSPFQQMDTWEMPKTISPGVRVRARLDPALRNRCCGHVKPLAIIEHETPPCTCSLLFSGFVIILFVLYDHVSWSRFLYKIRTRTLSQFSELDSLVGQKPCSNARPCARASVRCRATEATAFNLNHKKSLQHVRVSILVFRAALVITHSTPLHVVM